MRRPDPAQLTLFEPAVPPARTAGGAEVTLQAGSATSGGPPPARRATRKLFSDQRLSLCVLGSGSGGNATVARFGDRAILIDAGLGPRTCAKRLAQAGMTLTELDAICLTHLDTDHFRKSWVGPIRDLKLTLYIHRWHLPDLRRVQDAHTLIEAGCVRTFDDDGFALFDETAGASPPARVDVSIVRLQHDRQGTIGYRFDYAGGARGSLGYATDLGHAPEPLLARFAGVDLLCLEANYDEHMTIHSPRPSYVNRRNMSDSGHLSNDQALAAVREIDARSPHGTPRHVVLMHRSTQCNHPTKLRRVFEQHPTIAARLTLAEQRTRTRWLHATPAPATTRHQMPIHQRIEQSV